MTALDQWQQQAYDKLRERDGRGATWDAINALAAEMGRPGPQINPMRVIHDGVTRAEYRRFLKALRKKQKQARCRGYSP